MSATSTTSSKESSPLPFISFPVSRPTDIVTSLPSVVLLGRKSNMFESLFVAPETAQKEQPPANTKSAILEVLEPSIPLRTDRMRTSASTIAGKVSLVLTPLEMQQFRQQNADQIPNRGTCNSVHYYCVIPALV
jgi:hypothetical protein